MSGGDHTFVGNTYQQHSGDSLQTFKRLVAASCCKLSSDLSLHHVSTNGSLWLIDKCGQHRPIDTGWTYRIKVLSVVNVGKKGTKRGSGAMATAPISKAPTISTAASSSSSVPAPVAVISEPSDTDNSSDSSSDSSSSSNHRSKKSKKKSKKHAKSKKQVKKDKKAKKQEKRHIKALLTETGPEKKARMALTKARDQALAKVQSSKNKNAEQMVGKLATALAGITSTIGKDSFDFIPGMIKDPMMDAYTELQGISATAVLIVQSEGKSDEEIPDPKAGISHISQSIERVIANTLSSEPSLHIGQRIIASHTCG
jgi:hypothetical protein